MVKLGDRPSLQLQTVCHIISIYLFYVIKTGSQTSTVTLTHSTVYEVLYEISAGVHLSVWSHFYKEPAYARPKYFKNNLYYYRKDITEIVNLKNFHNCKQSRIRKPVRIICSQN